VNDVAHPTPPRTVAARAARPLLSAGLLLARLLLARLLLARLRAGHGVANALDDALDVPLCRPRQRLPLALAPRLEAAELMAGVPNDPRQAAAGVLAGNLDLLLDGREVASQLAAEGLQGTRESVADQVLRLAASCLLARSLLACGLLASGSLLCGALTSCLLCCPYPRSGIRLEKSP